ncbi:MAG TPA: hypothetical protein VJL88_15235 [Nitrospira sp.]|nr:hypothetical protein [Nitrospira sp.]
MNVIQHLIWCGAVISIAFGNISFTFAASIESPSPNFLRPTDELEDLLDEIDALAYQLKPDSSHGIYRGDVPLAVEAAVSMALGGRKEKSRRLFDQTLLSMLEEIEDPPNFPVTLDLRIVRLKEIAAGLREAGFNAEMENTITTLERLVKKALQSDNALPFREMELAHLLMLRNDFAGAALRLDKARNLANESDDLIDRASIYRFLATLYAEAGEDEKAWQCLVDLIKTYDSMTDGKWANYSIRYHVRVQSHAITTVAHMLAGHPDAARKTLAQAWQLVVETPEGDDEGRVAMFKETAMRDVAWAASHVGDYQLAMMALQGPNDSAYSWRAAPFVVKALVKADQLDSGIRLLEDWPCAAEKVAIAHAEAGKAEKAMAWLEHSNANYENRCRESRSIGAADIADRIEYRWLALGYLQTHGRSKTIQWAHTLPLQHKLTALLGLHDGLVGARPLLWWRPGSSSFLFQTPFSQETLNLVPTLKTN